MQIRCTRRRRAQLHGCHYGDKRRKLVVLFDNAKRRCVLPSHAGVCAQPHLLIMFVADARNRASRGRRNRCSGSGRGAQDLVSPPEAFVFVVPLCARSGRGCVLRRTVLGARRGSGRILRAFGRLQLAFLSLLVCLECYFRPLAAPVIYYPGAHGVPRVAALGGLVWPARAGVNACRARARAQPCSSCRR